jgi:hypothetical protein
MQELKVGDPVWVKHWTGRGAAKGRIVEIHDNYYLVSINGQRQPADKQRVKPR